MLKQTLDAVSRLDYPNFECVVIINNTPDPAFWQPIQDHCRALGERFKFINAEKVEGFKAGALRIAMERTAADAEIIGIIDADYVVQPDWLKDLVPVFADPRVGLVQAPQDHRDGDRSLMHYIMNGEYAGFFDIGMVQRNEANAIIVHGTMCLIRRAAMDMAGGWVGDTICEDTDLGLCDHRAGLADALHQHALRPRPAARHLRGLQEAAPPLGLWRLPDRQEALAALPARREPAVARISGANSRLGWLNWLGAESLGVVVAILNLIWVPIVAFADIAIPDKILTLPIIAAFVVSLVHFVALYRLRVKVKAGQMLGAMIAAMCVQWTVSRAVAQGLITEHLPFARTSKGGLSRMSIEFQAFWEAVIGVLAAGRRDGPDRDQRHQAGARDLHLRRRAGAGKPAFPVGGCDRDPRELAHQRIRVLAQQCGAGRRTDRPAPGLAAHPNVVANPQPVTSDIQREAS